MKSFKVREGKTLIDGILYGESPQPNPIMGKWGKIASINIGGTQFFPLSGTFDDGTTSVSTEGAEETKPAKVKKSKKGVFTLNENR